MTRGAAWMISGMMTIVILVGVGPAPSWAQQEEGAAVAGAAPATESPRPLPDEPPAVATKNWPGFRGVQASGVAEGKGVPVHWDSATGENIRWRTAIPGLGHSAPVVWGERVFVTTAVNKEGEPELNPVMTGATESADEAVEHDFKVYCLDLATGKVLWERTAYTGVPQVKRHPMSSHANSTPAVDGTHVVAFFGSEGLYCYDFEGELLWKADLGFLDATWFRDPEDQWGFGSSPVIHGSKVIVVCDVNNQSFIAAYDVAKGTQLWRTDRDELPGWGSPTVHVSDERAQVIVNGFQHIGSYDLETGKALWWLHGGGDIPVPTPVVAHGLAFITNSHGRMRPVYAIRLDAGGDVSLADGETSNDAVVWSEPRRGSYLPTPIVVGDQLYVGNDSGVLTCYRARTGEQLFRERIGDSRSSFTASAVAAGGRLYYTDKECQTHVLEAGETYHHLGTASVSGTCLSTPAIAGDMMLIRTATHLFGIGDTGDAPGVRDEAEVVAGAPSEETAQPAAPVRTDWSEVELTDPAEILRNAEAVIAGLEAVRYESQIYTTDAEGEKTLRATATVTSSGSTGFFPERLAVDGEMLVAAGEDEGEGPQKVRVSGGFDGDRFWAVDYDTKTVHSDFDYSVLGSKMQPLLGVLMFEFSAVGSLQRAAESEGLVLVGTTEISGVPCYEVRLPTDPEKGRETHWFIGTRDMLPRARDDRYVDGEGKAASNLKLLKTLEPNPELGGDWSRIAAPKGFAASDQPVP